MNGLSHASGVAFNTFSAADDFFNAYGQYKQTTSPPNVLNIWENTSTCRIR